MLMNKKVISLKQNNLIKILVMLFCSLLYLILSWKITGSGFFIWDDSGFLFDKVITSNEPGSILTSPHYGMYHPITSLWLKMNHIFHGNNPQILHIENICIHLINSYLVYKILRMISPNALIGFIIFLFHPLSTETVFWITSVKDLLYSFFALLSIFFFIKFKKDEKSKRSIKLTFLFVIMALLSKPQAIILPFILIAIDYLYNRRFSWQIIRRVLPLIAFSLAILIVNLYIKFSYKDASSLPSYSLTERFIISSISFTRHIVSSILPIKLSIFYPYPFKPGESIIKFIPQVLFVLCYCGILYYTLRRKHFQVSFILLTSAILAIPVVQILPIGDSLYNDRYSYLQIFIVTMGIIFLIDSTEKSAGRKFMFIPIGLYIFFIMGSFQQRNAIWKDNQKVFLSAIKHYPNSEILSNTVGVLYIKSNNLKSALHYLDIATSVDPNFAQAFYNKGIAFEKTRNYAQAISQYNKAIALHNTYEEPRFRLSQIYYNKAQYDSVEFIVRQSIYNQSISADMLDLYGKLLYQTGKVSQSVKYYEMAIKLDNANPAYQYNLAVSVGYMGNYKRAETILQSCIKLNPRFHEAYYLLGIVKIKLGGNGCFYLETARSLGNNTAVAALKEFC